MVENSAFPLQVLCHQCLVGCHGHLGIAYSRSFSSRLGKLRSTPNLLFTSPRFSNLSLSEEIAVSTTTLKMWFPFFAEHLVWTHLETHSQSAFLWFWTASVWVQPPHSSHHTSSLLLSVHQKTQCFCNWWGNLWFSAASQQPYQAAWRVTASVYWHTGSCWECHTIWLYKCRSNMIPSPQPNTRLQLSLQGLLSFPSLSEEPLWLAQPVNLLMLFILLSHLVSAHDFRVILTYFRKTSHLRVEAEKSLNNLVKCPK